MCKTGHNNMTLTAVEQQIAWEYLEAYLSTVILLKSAYFKHFEQFATFENLKQQILLQTTVNMCVTGHNYMTFTVIEKKIAWEYLEVHLIYSDFA